MQKILKDYYEIIEYDLKSRPVVMENIEKVINCGDPFFGGAMYGCSHCGTFKFVPFRCHSKFCPTCGAKFSNDRSTAMSFKLINYTHRHLIFTIDDSLRHFFLEDRSLLNCLLTEGGFSDATQNRLSNMSAAALAVLLLPFPGLIPTMGKTSPFITTGMKTILSSERLFRQLILLSRLSSTSLKKVSR